MQLETVEWKRKNRAICDFGIGQVESGTVGGEVGEEWVTTASRVHECSWRVGTRAIMAQGEPVRFGTPSAEEWRGLWLFAKGTTAHDSDEFERVYQEFEERLASLGQVGPQEDCDFYFIGDDRGSRTHELEMVNPKALTVKLLRTLQGWLQEPEFRHWRILTMNYLGPDGAIMVYPSVIRTSRRFKDDIVQCVEDVRRRRLAGEMW